MLYEANDVVLNFRRSRVYFFDKNIQQHRQEVFSCRIATFEEQAKFKALGCNDCKLSDIGIKRDWKNAKKIKIEVEVSRATLFMLNDVGKKIQSNSYLAVITELLSAYRGKEKTIDMPQPKSKHISKDKLIQQITNLIQNNG